MKIIKDIIHHTNKIQTSFYKNTINNLYISRALTSNLIYMHIREPTRSYIYSDFADSQWERYSDFSKSQWERDIIRHMSYDLPPSTNAYEHEYNKIWVLLVIALCICLLLFFIAYFFSFNTIKDSEKLSEYECGFEPFDNATRHPFDVHFYIVGILFLIFDVEIALLFPWVLSLYSNNLFSFYIMIVFLSLLTIGFFYEWHRGALVWPHQQYSTIFTDYKES